MKKSFTKHRWRQGYEIIAVIPPLISLMFATQAAAQSAAIRIYSDMIKRNE